MVFNPIKNIFLSSITIFIMFAMLSCKENRDYFGEDCTNYNYSDCNTLEPVHADVILKLTINAENNNVPIFIFEGFIEDNILVYADTVNTEEFRISLPINTYYSAKAFYKKNGKNIIAVDGDKVEKIETRICDSVCWSTKEGNINLTLKK